ncbi:MAG: hypothetical protein ACLVIP_09755 [Ruminococcus sp.]
MFIPLGVLLPYLLNITKFKSVFLISLAFFSRYRDNAVYHRQRAL